ncbi:DUF4030 domain-containing protein [Bacillus sp. ISL-55]|uniref:DUF4030 domain-containing protein n=1 Tax=Bacillus sp. ISL-55 TaxID=2819134 RepID=UPI001BE6F87D|nr:DUF4030 domain-containing protein [Bacillus sp. ISL-55]MBT2695169.1 DUF4030 domain-containing protein [Bacillus sp. ISL-55]
MEEKVLQSAKSYFKHQVDIEQFKRDTYARLELNQGDNYGVTIIKRSYAVRFKKVLTLSGAAVLVLSLFIGSAFVSPAIAQVVAKVPFFGQIFGNKSDIIEQISEELIAKGYKVTAGVSYPEKVITISVDGSEEYLNQVKNDVNQIASNILHSSNYDAYKVKVVLSRPKEIEWRLSEKELKHAGIIEDINEKLNTQGYNVLEMRYDLPKKLEIGIPDTETRISEMEQIVKDVLSENGISDVYLKVKKIDMAELEMDERWRGILDLVGEDILGKKDYKVRMVGYSIHSEPEIQAFITLSGETQNTRDFAKQLEKVINDFLRSEDMKTKVGNDSYHITIYNKENKIVN